MAIIYNYPLNSILLAEDMLIGTSTKIVNGQPKNATKNFSIADLTGFIKQNVSLDDVLQVGNASLLDAKVGSLYLYDTPVTDYGNIALNQNRFSFSTVTHGEVFRAQRDMFSSFSSSGYRGSFEVSNITANRVWDFPNKSGTVALTSDILADLLTEQTIDSYIGSRLRPTNPLSNGFWVNRNVNGSVGYIALNSNTGNGAVSILGAGIDTSPYTKSAYVAKFGPNYYVPILAGKGGLFGTEEVFVGSTDGNDVSILTGPAFASMTRKFTVKANGQLLIQTTPTTGATSDKLLVRDTSGNVKQIDYPTIPTTPTLQDVTSAGNETTNDIIVGVPGDSSIISPSFIGVQSGLDSSYMQPGSISAAFFNTAGDGRLEYVGISYQQIYKNFWDGAAYVRNFFNFPIIEDEASATLALTSDITTPTLQEVTDEGATTTNTIRVEDAEFNAVLGYDLIAIANSATNEGISIYSDLINFFKNGISSDLLAGLYSGSTSILPNNSGELQSITIQTTSFTALISAIYTTNGTLTVTDPTPVTNKGYIVHVIGGTSTIGGVGYTVGDLVYRYYNGTTWTSTNMNSSNGVTSVGLTMPSAFSVTNSPITSSGDIAVTGAGLVSQYVRGDGTLANFPNSTGGGSSVNYYLNGSVSQGTFGGTTYYQMSKTPILGAGTNFTRTNGAGNGYIASFITDAGDPSQLNIPGGNWNVEFYFNASSGGGSPSFYAELYKVSATNVFTLIASDSLNPEGITNGTTVDQYYTSIPVPQTTLLVTDRLAVRIFVNTGGRTITLHTENGNLSEVLTTFTTGLTALNGLTDQVQFFDVGTGATNFNISSSGDTHTFNLLFNIRRNANNSSNNNINYNGYAVTGSAESSAVWTITRLTISASGAITVGTATNVAWTDRETTIYT